MRPVLTALALCLAAPAAAQPVMLTTIGMIGDPAQRIAGDCVRVEVLIGPGLDPHLYQPRPSDVARLRAADRIVSLGLGLEGRLGEILARVGAAVLGESVPVDRLLTEDAGLDPHVWMDPSLWPQTFPALADELTGLAPDCAEGIAERRDLEIARAEALDLWAQAALETIPEDQRILLTAHDAFAYFARRYGLETVGIQGISTESEPSIADIDAAAQLAVARAVPAAFIETTLNPRAVRALIEAAAARGHALTIGGELYSDALGEAGSGAETWPGMILANVTTITEALGGTVPPVPGEVLP